MLNTFGFSQTSTPVLQEKKQATPPHPQATKPDGETTISKEPLDTLENALTDTYLKNPDLEAARAELRQTDEKACQAFSEWRPNISGSLSQEYTKRTDVTGTTASGHKKTAGLTVTQSLFSGGGTIFRTQSAETNVRAGRQKLISAEQEVLLSAVQSFLQVYTVNQVVGFLKGSEKVLQSTLDQTKARYEVGEVTRTEVAAAAAQLAEAVARRVAAQGRLENAKAAFLKTTGRLPGNLAFPTTQLCLPQSQQQAIDIALKQNPTLGTAELQEKASEYNTKSEVSSLLPQINAQATSGRSIADGAANNPPGIQKSSSFTVTVTVPIYNQGTTYSRIREANQVNAQTRFKRQSTQRSVVEAVTKAWSDWHAAQKSIEQLDLQVKANALALEGVREEYNLGLKSLLDVLQIEDGWRRSQISWAEATQSEMLARFQLMALIGLLTAKALNLKVPYYDPNIYYEEHHNAMF